MYDKEYIFLALANRPLEPYRYESALSNVRIARHQQATTANIGSHAIDLHATCGKFSM
jgi:hypothetical protein